MPRAWRPLLAGAIVVVAVLLLAQWPIFEPSSEGPTLLGGADRGEVLFAEECAGCHGRGGTGGTGPALADSGLDGRRDHGRDRAGARHQKPSSTFVKYQRLDVSQRRPSVDAIVAPATGSAHPGSERSCTISTFATKTP